jgi:hypothetical protein
MPERGTVMIDNYYILPTKTANTFRRVVLCIWFEADEPELHLVYADDDFTVFHFEQASVKDCVVATKICTEFGGRVSVYADGAFKRLQYMKEHKEG